MVYSWIKFWNTFTNYYGNATAQINTNYILEFTIHQEASGGGWYRLYVNGVLQVEGTGVSNTGRYLNYVWAGYCCSDSGGSSQSFYFDNAVVASSYIGAP